MSAELTKEELIDKVRDLEAEVEALETKLDRAEKKEEELSEEVTDLQDQIDVLESEPADSGTDDLLIDANIKIDRLHEILGNMVNSSKLKLFIEQIL